MRHTIRPFIKEFKTRSPKSSRLSHQASNDADKDSAKAPFLNSGIFDDRSNDHDDKYEAALRAADAVFGNSGRVASLDAQAPTLDPHVGTVLPSLIGKDNAPDVRLEEADEAALRVPKAGKAKRSSPARGKKRDPELKNETMNISAEQSVANSMSETLTAPAARRGHSSIQKRWVFKTELKAGQKWKRRFGKAAR